jgi:hypothetical protein
MSDDLQEITGPNEPNDLNGINQINQTNQKNHFCAFLAWFISFSLAVPLQFRSNVPLFHCEEDL